MTVKPIIKESTLLIASITIAIFALFFPSEYDAPRRGVNDATIDIIPAIVAAREALEFNPEPDSIYKYAKNTGNHILIMYNSHACIA